MNEMQQKYLENLRAEEIEQLTNHAEIIEHFKVDFPEKDIVLTEENFRYEQTIGIVAVYPGILSILEPEIEEDKEGLINFKILDKLYKKLSLAFGYLYAEKHIAMAHPYFRRAFYAGNGFAPRFIEMFWKINNKDIDCFIALDLDRVRINVDSILHMELDTWFGPAFNSEIVQIPDGIVKLRPPMDLDGFDMSFFFSDVYAVDIKWATKNGIKSFQAEEIKTEKVRILKDGKEYFPVRYLHAEFDINNDNFRHFDGAIHFYTTEEYFARRDSDFNYNAKNSKKIKTLSQKLFKMNGIVNVETFISFSSHFFAGNSLMFEYFEGDYPPHILEFLRKKRAAQNNDII